MNAPSWHPDLPEDLRDHSRLAFIAAMLAHREGDPPPPMPSSVTAEILPRLLAHLDDPKARRAVVIHLSPLTERPNRAERRRGR